MKGQRRPPAGRRARQQARRRPPRAWQPHRLPPESVVRCLPPCAPWSRQLGRPDPQRRDPPSGVRSSAGLGGSSATLAPRRQRPWPCTAAVARHALCFGRAAGSSRARLTQCARTAAGAPTWVWWPRKVRREAPTCTALLVTSYLPYAPRTPHPGSESTLALLALAPTAFRYRRRSVVASEADVETARAPDAATEQAAGRAELAERKPARCWERCLAMIADN